MAASELDTFAARLSQEELTQADQAVALLWFLRPEKSELSAAEIGKALHDLALSARVNVSRLSDQLGRHSDTVSGSRTGQFKLKLASVPKLDAKYLPLCNRPAVVVTHSVLPEAQTKGTRRYLERLAWELNGAYENGFFNGCAVLCRRMTESLLIEAHEHSGHAAAIKRGNDYLGLGEIIGIAGSGSTVKLARGTPRVLERIKSVGDTAAHDKTYITTATDIDDFSHDFRRVISELMHLAGIQPTGG